MRRGCRGVQCERGPLQRADGSARWAQGCSVVLAAVHGPRATAQRKEDPERAVIEVVCRPRTGLAGVRLLTVLGAVTIL